MPTEAETIATQEAKGFEKAGLVPPEFLPEPPPDVKPPEPPPDVEPPEPPPKPKPVLTSREPTVLRLPAGSPVLERDARGNPTVYDVKGVRTYAPGSTIYELGFRNEKEYRKAQGRGAGLGPHPGRKVPENSVVLFEGGKPVARYSAERFRDKPPDVDMDNVRVAVKGAHGKEVYLTNKQIDRLNQADTPADKLRVAQELRLVSKATTLKQFTTTGKDIAAARFVTQQASKRAVKLARQAQKGQQAAGKQLTDYIIDPKTKAIDITSAIDGGVPLATMQTAGYEVTQQEYNDIKTGLAEQARAMTALTDYKGKGDQYRISAYIHDNEANIPKAEETLLSMGFNEKQIQRARVDAFASPLEALSPAPPDRRTAIQKYTEERLIGIEKWNTDLKSDLEKSYAEQETYGGKLGVTASGGLLLAGATVLTAIPHIAGQIIVKPKDAPGIVWAVGAGLAAHVVNTGRNLVTGQYVPGLKAGDASQIVYDSAITYLVVSGIGRAGRAVFNRVTTYVSPRGVPVGTIAKEVSTGRIPNKAGITEQLAEAMNKVEQAAMTKSGKFTGNIPIEGTMYELRYLKTPIQQRIGNILWHGTKDELGVAGEVVKPSALRIAEQQGSFTVGGSGIYTNPWAAVGYSRGQNPGLMMVITDSGTIKSGASAFKQGLTQSDAFIRNASEGFYGSSKSWRGDFETEIVGAPGTVIKVPPPTADLFTRLVAGKYSDFFTYDAGKFVPIKVGFDARLIKSGTARMPTAAELYATKLMTAHNTLRDMVEASKHPGAVLTDISGSVKAMTKLRNLLREGDVPGGRVALPGVRDAYLNTNIGAGIRQWAADLWREAFNKTKREIPRADTSSRVFKEAMERNLERVYDANARAMIDGVKAIAVAYASSRASRAKTEASYLANLGLALESLAKSGEVETRAIQEVYSDARTRIGDKKISSPETPITRRTPGTPITPRTPETPETPRTPETPETPRTPRTPETPETPRTPETPETPRTPVTTGDGEEEKEWTKKEIESAIAWKAGFVVHAIKSPYRRGIDEATFSIKNLPAGLKVIPIHTGKGSLESSARVIKGVLKRKVTTDVGNQDAILTPHNGGRRVSISHRRDITGTVSQTTIKRGKSISKKKGRIFSSRIGGSEVLSRRALRGL